MTLPDPTDVIAPREDVPYSTTDFLQEMFTGAYLTGTVLKYHSLLLYSEHYEDGPRVWDVYIDECDGQTYIETLNLEAFQTLTELEQALDEIVAYDPDDRDEWVSSR